MRGVILDNIKCDYDKDSNIILEPENWMVMVIDIIYKDFNFLYSGTELKNPVNKNILICFHFKILKEIKNIFLGNKKFGSKGNFILISLIFYEKRVIKIEDEYFNEFIENFFEDKNLDLELLRKRIH